MNTNRGTPLTSFEGKLLEALVTIDGQRPTSARATRVAATQNMVPSVHARMGRRRAVLIGASLAAVVASAFYLGTPFSAPPPTNRIGATGNGAANTAATSATEVRQVAFTVVKNADGTVTFTVRDLIDTEAATAALNAAGIVGRVLNAATQACPAGSPTDRWRGALLSDLYKAHDRRTNSITFTSSVYPPGGGLLIVVSPTTTNPATGRPRDIWLMGMVYEHSEQIPTCVPQPQPQS